MKAAFANPFITSALYIFEKEINVTLVRKGMEKKLAPIPSLPISIIIGVTGPIKGQVVYSLDGNLAYNIAKAMLPGKLPVEIKKLTNSAVSEIANMITGRASIELAGESKLIDLTPPVVIIGQDVKVDFLTIPTICLSFLSEVGMLEINIALTSDNGE